MDYKSNMTIIERGFLLVIFAFSFYTLEGQQSQLSPLSYWVFTPSVYNPAIVGSKDFLSIGLISAFQGRSENQIINGNARFPKTIPRYFLTPDTKQYSNIGIGGSLFNDISGSSHNMGLSAAGSYQIPLSLRKLSFLSFGASVKGVYNLLDSGSMESPSSSKKTFYQNLDLGIYYYGTSFFSGLSATNLLGNPEKPDSLGKFAIPVSRQYFFTTGYKILISKSYNVVLEPSVLIKANDTTINNIADNINPIIKLYIDNICIGTYFLGKGNTSFFFEYRYPRFFIGAFFELPNKSPYFRSLPLFEFTAGINITSNKIKSAQISHW